MGETVVAIIRWTVRFGIVISLVFAFIVLFNFMYSMLSVVADGSVIGDMIALVQIWLPFDLNVLLAWAFTASTLYISYRVLMFSAGFLNKFIGNN